jgi:hypothetical protein
MYLDFDEQTLADRTTHSSKGVLGDDSIDSLGRFIHRPRFRASSAAVESGLVVIEHRVEEEWVTNATIAINIHLPMATDEPTRPIDYLASVQLSVLGVRNELDAEEHSSTTSTTSTSSTSSAVLNRTLLRLRDNCTGTIDTTLLPATACAQGLQLLVYGSVHMSDATVKVRRH